MASRPSNRRPPFAPAGRPSGLRLTALALAVFSALASILAAAGPAAGQQPEQQPSGGQDDVTVILNRGFRGQYRLAIPEIGRPALAGEAAAAAEELDKTLRNDLELSGAFVIQGPWAFRVLTLTGERTHDFEQYASLGNEFLLLGELDVERGGGDRIVFEGRLYDLRSGSSILAKRYRGTYSAARRIAHTFADEVIRYLTSRPGVSLTRIAFASDRTGKKELFVMDYDGAGVAQVTGHKSTSMSPAWRPDSGGLAYTSFVGGPPALYFADLVSGKKRPLVTDGDQNISPSYSPDGSRIVFSRALGANSEIFVAGADGSRPQQLTHNAAIDTNPAWSPTGGEIAFTSSRGGNPHIYVMDSEGTNLRRLSFEGDYNDGAAWSPTGEALAYASRRGGRFEIAVTRLATGETKVVTGGGGSNEEPSFSPDGRQIAFTSNRSGSKQLWVVDVETGQTRQLTRDGRNESPAWSPYPADRDSGDR
jgi:TolB protein